MTHTRRGFLCGAVALAASAETGEFQRATLEAVERAMPSGPPGWTLTFRTDIGTRQLPPVLNYSISWSDLEKRRRAEAAVLEAWTAYNRAHENDPRLGALRAELNKGAQAVGQAAGRNDLATMERLIKETDATSAKIRAIVDAHQRERDRISERLEAHDFLVRIAVAINEHATPETAEKAPPVAGLPVSRIPGRHVPDGSWAEECNHIYLRPRAGSRKAPVTEVHVLVEADSPRSRQVLEAIRWDELKRLLG